MRQESGISFRNDWFSVLEQNALWKAAKEADEHVENLEAELKDVQLSKEKLLDELFAERRFWWNEREHYKEKLEMKELELAAALEREEVRREEYETVAGENSKFFYSLLSLSFCNRLFCL